MENKMAGAVLSDRDILSFHRQEFDIVKPLVEEFIQPSSVDLRLGDTVIEYKLDEYLVGEDIPDSMILKRKIEDKEALAPGETKIFTLYETINIPNDCMGLLFARSSLTRLGISIEPIYFNPGYKGNPPLTITNNAKFKIFLKPLTRVAQLIVVKLFSRPFKTYEAVEDQKYYLEKAKPSEISKDREIKAILENLLKEKYPAIYEATKD